MSTYCFETLDVASHGIIIITHDDFIMNCLCDLRYKGLTFSVCIIVHYFLISKPIQSSYFGITITFLT